MAANPTRVRSSDPAVVPAKAVGRAGALLGMTGFALARTIGASEATVSRILNGDRPLSPDTKEGELAALLIRLYRSLDALVGNDGEKRLAWMNSHNRALNGVPRDLVQKAEGLCAAVAYLDRHASHLVRSLWEESWWRSIHADERDLWRGVEAQHVAAMMRLVDDLEEQALLEQILEGSKPPAPTMPKHRHYLLWTPFRYRTPVASRFRRAGEAGVWYGVEELTTACTELAYWRWRFLVDSDGLADSEIVVELTFFQARVSRPVLDLCAPPWTARLSVWRHPDDYGACQRLAQACREHGDVSWIRYASARLVDGVCAAVLEPACLRMKSTRSQQTWSCKGHSIDGADGP